MAAPTSFGRLHIAPYLGKFLENNPDLSVNIDLGDGFVDIVGEGYDLAIRIAELSDSSLVARRAGAGPPDPVRGARISGQARRTDVD